MTTAGRMSRPGRHVTGSAAIRCRARDDAADSVAVGTGEQSVALGEEKVAADGAPVGSVD